MDSAELPSNFHGYDISKIAEALERRKHLWKDEFETTPQFLARREKEQNRPLLGNIGPRAPLFFEFGDTFTYDADREEMHTSFDIRTSNRIPSADCDDLEVKLRLARVRVSFGDRQPSSFDKGTWTHSFPVKLNDARLLKPSLRLLLVATLTDYLNSASAKDPKAFLYESIKVVELKLIGLWIYNVKSGSIMSKHDVEYDDPFPAKPKPSDLLSQARELYAQGKDDEALIVTRRILLEEPMNGEAYLLMGKVQLRLGDVNTALSNFKTAIFWDHRLVDAYIELGKVYAVRGDCLTAKHYAESVLEIAPDNPDVIALQWLANRCRQ